jgi:ParB-like chromosome segregation protein Spo0J
LILPRTTKASAVKLGFKSEAVRIPIADIQPLRLVSATVKNTPKYSQIVSSIGEVGVIEPPVVVTDKTARGKYLLLDGHLRLEVLKDMGATEIVCLVSTDDEAFTYNKRVNRLAIIQEHKMILKAIERGVPEARLAKALNIDISTLRHKRKLLDGVCSEAAEILKDKFVPTNTFEILKKMVPLRQIESAELMVAMNRYTFNYARSLLAATSREQLVARDKSKVFRGLSDEQMAMMERESSNLQREFKLAEQSYGADHLDLVLTKGYLAKLMSSARVVRYLAQHHEILLAEFGKIAQLETKAA